MTPGPPPLGDNPSEYLFAATVVSTVCVRRQISCPSSTHLGIYLGYPEWFVRLRHPKIQLKIVPLMETIRSVMNSSPFRPANTGPDSQKTPTGFDCWLC